MAGGVTGSVQVQKDAKSKKMTYKYGEVKSGTQRGIKVGAKTYALRGEGDKPGKEVNVHKSGAYVGKEAKFYEELATVIASVHVETGAYPGKGTVLVGKSTKVIIDPK